MSNLCSPACAAAMRCLTSRYEEGLNRKAQERETDKHLSNWETTQIVNVEKGYTKI